MRIPEVTIGKVVDYGVKDSLNMGACMAPAAADTIERNLEDLGREPEDYDRIITGDLGYVGKQILLDLLKGRGIDIKEQQYGLAASRFSTGRARTPIPEERLRLFRRDPGGPDSAKTHLRRVETGAFRADSALLSTVSYNEGQSVPGIAHGVVLEHC